MTALAKDIRGGDVEVPMQSGWGVTMYPEGAWCSVLFRNCGETIHIRVRDVDGTSTVEVFEAGHLDSTASMTFSHVPTAVAAIAVGTLIAALAHPPEAS